MNELLCCPFCGNRELRYTTLKISREKVMAAVRCMQCLTCGPDGCGKEREEAEKTLDLAGKLISGSQTFEIRSDQYHIRGVDRHICAGAHCDSGIGCSQSRTVVDAVSDKCNRMTVTLETFNIMDFILRKKLSMNLCNAKLLCNHLCSVCMISGQHDKTFYTQFFKSVKTG